MRRYPQHVRTVVLDGVAPPDLRVNLDVWPTRDAALAQLFAACAEQASASAPIPISMRRLRRSASELGAGRRLNVADPRTGSSTT